MIPLAQPSLYPPSMTLPMEAELANVGVKPLHSAQEVDRLFADSKQTILLMVNSVCGCAAGNARPAMALAMKHSKLPAQRVTVFAGVDREATQAGRAHAPEYPPSSPSIFLFKDGKCVFALQRTDIQGRDPRDIAHQLTRAFDNYC